MKDLTTPDPISLNDIMGADLSGLLNMLADSLSGSDHPEAISLCTEARALASLEMLEEAGLVEPKPKPVDASDEDRERVAQLRRERNERLKR